MADLVEFRREIREWLETSCPVSMRTPMPEDDAPHGGTLAPPKNRDVQRWLEVAAERGLTLPVVPREYGGAGLSAQETHVFYEELDRIGGRAPLVGVGAQMLVPTLLEFGSEDQKRRFIPRIARGEARWCQGFSEPGAGSDLAALQLQAVRDGDHYVLNGQKIWTSWADRSDWMIVLVRTNPAARPRQKGISFLLVDLRTPGITFRPIEMLSGRSEFFETFFDDVRVPVSHRVGPEDDGWTVTKFFLVADRRSLRRWADDYGAVDLLEFWHRAGGSAQTDCGVIRSELDELALQATINRIERLESEGADVDSYAPVLKYWWAEHTKRRHGLATLLLEWACASGSEELAKESDRYRTRMWLDSLANSIGAGTSEIQLNVIAKTILGMPTR